ncbi:uncharacterized protein LOC129883579 [Solanum dulcamara]|uniref:uncharacterized protein LOC129883579 n=1 Tax=Solanum dulcamara TaxID=45834 RepID=UPI002486414B|nr:uncharacterized protein LOC129883579 [Solanum dulcamara]
MFRAYVIDFKVNWDDHLPLIEFAYNNNYHSCIHMVPFEVLYGRRCRSLIGLFEITEVAMIGLESVHEMEKGVMRFGKKRKLIHRYVGAHHILGHFGKVAYELDLPVELESVHPVFHVSLLYKCTGDPILVVPLESVGVKEIVSYEEFQLRFLTIKITSSETKKLPQ